MPDQPRPVPDALLRRLLPDDLRETFEQGGVRPAAVRAWSEVPAQGESPARRGPAVVCRLYPAADEARLIFGRWGQQAVEAVVFEDPDDELEWNLKAGFENALYALNELYQHHRQATQN